MPLFIPILVGLLSGSAALLGASKIKSAKVTSNEAESIQRNAEKIYKSAKQKLQRNRKATSKSIEDLGSLKLEAANNEISDFITEFSKVKKLIKKSKSLAKKEMEELGEYAFTVKDLKGLETISSAAASGAGVASGALLAMGAFGSASLLGTAATGTAISGLSGVAATNATLSWIGGGALAAGGGGVAAGAGVLGGLIVGPALLLTGSLFNSKAKKQLNQAKINYAKARKFSSDVNKAVVELNIIQKNAKELYGIIEKLRAISKAANEQMKKEIRKGGKNMNNNLEAIQKASYVAIIAVQSLKAAIDVPLLSKDGQLTATARAFAKEKKKELKNFNI